MGRLKHFSVTHCVLRVLTTFIYCSKFCRSDLSFGTYLLSMYRTRIQSVTFYSPVFSNDHLKQVHYSTDTNPHIGCSLSDVLQEPHVRHWEIPYEFRDFYCNFTLSKLMCTHCSTLDSCQSMIKHLQQSACSHPSPMGAK